MTALGNVPFPSHVGSTSGTWSLSYFIQLPPKCWPCLGSKFQTLVETSRVSVPQSSTQNLICLSIPVDAQPASTRLCPESVLCHFQTHPAKMFLRQNLFPCQDMAMLKQDTVEYLLKHGNKGQTLGFRTLFFTSWRGGGHWEKWLLRSDLNELENKTNNFLSEIKQTIFSQDFWDYKRTCRQS